MSERFGKATIDDSERDVMRWSLDQVIDSIVSTHHAYVREALPTITRYLARLVEEHGARRPELLRVAAYFDQVRDDLELHMQKEEQVLFPYVRDLMLRTGTRGGSRSPFQVADNPIRMMEREHREVIDALRIIRALTKEYWAPADGGTTYEACMAELARFESDLLRHVHIENSVLFPRAFELEAGICA